MDKSSGQFIVYFDGTYWAGLFERVEKGKLQVAKVTFGAEPSEPELYEFIKAHGYELDYSPAVDTVVKEAKRNPKRMQREARKQMAQASIGTKSQQALKLQHEQNKQERKTLDKEKRLAEEKRKFEMKQQKKREKHRGR